MVVDTPEPLPDPAPNAPRTLAALRVLAGLSQAEMGGRLGRSQKWISRLEAGEVRDIDPVLLGQLSAHYRVTPKQMDEALSAAREAAQERLAAAEEGAAA